MNELPESLRVEILMQFFDSFKKTGMIPHNSGSIFVIAQRTKVCLVSEGEYIVRYGVIGLEMYIVVDGEVEITDEQGTVIAMIGPG
jgi:hypothetical protein